MSTDAVYSALVQVKVDKRKGLEEEYYVELSMCSVADFILWKSSLSTLLPKSMGQTRLARVQEWDSVSKFICPIVRNSAVFKVHVYHCVVHLVFIGLIALSALPLPSHVPVPTPRPVYHSHPVLVVYLCSDHHIHIIISPCLVSLHPAYSIRYFT